jgi:L-threonylcarbamoyladenylate synthase
MQTKYISVNPINPEPSLVAEAAAVLARGALVAFPTETVYGLGADAANPHAIRKIFEVKGRPSDNPLIVHIADEILLDNFAMNVSPLGKKLIESFWPGPLTLVFEASRNVPREVTAGLDTVAVRMPHHPVALSLLAAFGRGIVAPSANVSGGPSPTTAQHVMADLGGAIEMILDGGPTEIGLESTVLDVTVNPPLLLRQGGLTTERLEAVIGEVRTTNDNSRLRRSPGTRHRHYAPRANVVLVAQNDSAHLETLLLQNSRLGKRVGIIVHTIIPVETHGAVERRLSSDAETFAKTFFSVVRELDEQSLDVIVIESVEERGIGAAVMERLRKAAEG